MAVWLYGSHKFMTILLRFLTWNVPFWKKKKVSPILSPSVLVVLYLFVFLYCPGKDGHPSSRVNFRERSYQVRKKPTHLSKPRALAHTLIVPPLRPHRSFFLTFYSVQRKLEHPLRSFWQILIWTKNDSNVRRPTSGHVESAWMAHASI